MRIAVLGSGYVGLCTGIGFATKGHEVACIDIDPAKVAMINKGKVPFYEQGLQENLRKFLRKKTFEARTSLAGTYDVIFLCVGTPADEQGAINLSHVEAAAKTIGMFLSKQEGYCVVAIKSTVIPGTAERIARIIELHSGKKIGADFGLCSNPEFLREGRALEDFLKPGYIVIGEHDKKAGSSLKRLYAGFRAPVVRTNLRTAEMIKYASNAFLSTKISFINEIGNMCKQLGIDAYDVADAIGRDKRIGREFLNAGSGFGGSCFTKDVRALISAAGNYDPALLREVLAFNARQRRRIVDLLKEKVALRGSTVAVLGLAFKSGTDDVRDAVAGDVIGLLKQEGARVVAYDPKAEENMKAVHPDIAYARSVKEALRNADACLILTDWDEFRTLSDRDFAAMKNRIIIEGRKVLRKPVKGAEGVCW